MLPTFKNPFISLPNMHRCIKLCKRVFLISPFIRCFVRHRCAESFCPQPRLWEGGQRQATDGCFNPVGASPKPFLKISWRKCPYNKTKPRIITQRTKSSLCMLPWCAEESQTHLTKLNITPEWHGGIGTYKHVRLIRKPVMLHFLKHEDWHPKLKHLRGKSDRSQTPCAEELCSYWTECCNASLACALNLFLTVDKAAEWRLCRQGQAIWHVVQNNKPSVCWHREKGKSEISSLLQLYSVTPPKNRVLEFRVLWLFPDWNKIYIHS